MHYSGDTLRGHLNLSYGEYPRDSVLLRILADGETSLVIGFSSGLILGFVVVLLTGLGWLAYRGR